MKVRKATEAEWKAFIEDCEGATFFHTPDWYKIWEEFEKLSIDTRLLSFKSGRQVLLPLAYGRKYKKLLKHYISSPRGTFGGYLVKEKLIAEEIHQLEEYLKKIPAIEIRENPYCQVIGDELWTSDGFTQVLDLEVGWSAILKGFSNNHLRSIKKGIRDGVLVKLAEINDWPDYYKLYEQTFQRWKRKPRAKYPWFFFEKIRELDISQCKLWLAWYNGKPVAGSLCFYHHKHVVYWHGASSEKFFSFRPVHVLKYHIIQDAIKKDYRWLDFNPSAGLEGVIKFKKGFGTEKLRSRILIKEPEMYSILFRIAQKVYSFNKK